MTILTCVCSLFIIHQVSICQRYCHYLSFIHHSWLFYELSKKPYYVDLILAEEDYYLAQKPPKSGTFNIAGSGYQFKKSWILYQSMALKESA